jgi:hypothetical protein
MKERVYLEVVEFGTSETATRFDITDMTDREVERLERALTRKMDLDRFYLQEVRKPEQEAAE